MSGYTVRNLKDVEDAAVKFGLSPAVEARFARDDLACEQNGLSYQRFAPDTAQPFAHRHATHEELYVVLSGGGRILLDGEPIELRPLDAVRVSPATVRSFVAGPDGLELLAFGPLGSGDVEIVRD